MHILVYMALRYCLFKQNMNTAFRHFLKILNHLIFLAYKKCNYAYNVLLFDSLFILKRNAVRKTKIQDVRK